MQDANIPDFNSVPILLDEFRRHNHHFQSALTQIFQDDTTDAHHLTRRVCKPPFSAIFPDRAEWEMPRTNGSSSASDGPLVVVSIDNTVYSSMFSPFLAAVFRQGSNPRRHISDLKQCSIEVHLREIIDLPGVGLLIDTFETKTRWLNNSRLKASRITSTSRTTTNTEATKTQAEKDVKKYRHYRAPEIISSSCSSAIGHDRHHDDNEQALGDLFLATSTRLVVFWSKSTQGWPLSDAR
ncbi:hypothetical protein FB446DRAFT_789293 [Lentinula raphanica]|nr:hypothetical protein FB446DRAFT_789293 [Lentinula raphanica]